MTWTTVPRKYKPKNKDYPTINSRWIDRETGLRKNFDGTLQKPKFLKDPMNPKANLTRKKKKVVAKLMYEAGWGSKRIAQWMKVKQPTILDWKNIPTPESLQAFEQYFKAAMLDYDMEATFSVKSQIMKLIPTETNIDKLVKAGEFFSGEKEKRQSQNNTQVNIYGNMLKKYGEGTTEIPMTIITSKKK